MSLGGGGSDFLKEGDWNAMCWECGRKKKAGDLWKYWQGYWICPRHWNPRQPQDFARAVKETITPPWVQPMAEYKFALEFIITQGSGTDFVPPNLIITQGTPQPFITEQ